MRDEQAAKTLAQHIATPALMGQYLGKRLFGRPYKVYPWIQYLEQKVLYEIMQPGRKIIIVSVPPQNGKYLTLSTRIPTPSGFTIMGDLEVGSQVIGADGKPCTVVGVSEVQWKPVHRITFDDGSTIEAGPEHNWLTFDNKERSAYNGRHRDGSKHADYDGAWWDWVSPGSNRGDDKRSPQVRTTEQLLGSLRCEGGTKANHSIPNAHPLDLPEADLPIDPWILGYWLGNGSRGGGSIACGSKDGDFDVEFVHARTGGNPRKEKGACHITTVPGLIGKLKALGIERDKTVPAVYLRASADQRLALLQGLMDSDGTPERQHRVSGTVSFSSKDEHLTLAVAELAHTLGAKTHRQDKRAILNGIDYGPSYRVVFTPPFNPFSLPRKADLWAPGAEAGRGLSRHHRKIVNIEDTGVLAPMKCISVDGPGSLYLCGEQMVPTHNTTYFGLLLPVWYLGMNPGHQVIFISYNEPQASKWGLRSRDTFKRHGPELFGEGVHPSKDSQLDWSLTNGFGGMMSAGILGGITGNPGHLIICVTGDSVVMTQDGPRRVDRIYQDGYDGVDVLSYHHETSRDVYAPVSAARRSQRSDLVRVTTEAGRTLTCTPDHRVWVEGSGYREARLLQPGWPVRVMPGMWDLSPDEDQQRASLQTVSGLLSPSETDRRPVPLFGMRHRSHRGSRHVPQTTPSGGVYMRTRVHGNDLYESLEATTVPVWPPTVEGQAVLLAPLPHGVRSDQEVSARRDLPDVQGHLRGSLKEETVLLSGLRGSRSFDSDARQGEQPLQDRDLVHVRLQGEAAQDHGGRRWLRRLRYARRSLGASRRPQPTKQRLDQSGDVVQDAPRSPSQEHLDAVSVVEYLHGDPVDVYDLTVPATGNFYVNNILIHNCDDLLKGDEDAGSAAVKAKIEGEVQNSVFSRFQNNTKMLVIATRWAEDDPSGRLIAMAQAEGYKGRPVEIVNIKAIAEPTFDERQEMTPDGLAEWRDFLGRKEGEALKGQFDQGFYEEVKATVDSYGWYALYQGEPTVREGGMFPIDRWGYYNSTTLPDMVKRVRVWDLAASEGKGDFSVGTLMGRGSDGNFYVLDRARFRKGSDGVLSEVRDAAQRDGHEVPILIEQERAGAGKTVLAMYQRELVGFNVSEAKAEGSKESRATPYSNEQRKGNIYLPEGKPWLKEWRDEHLQMDGNGKMPRHDDQIDTGAYAFKFLTETGVSEFWDPSMLGQVNAALAPEEQMEAFAMQRLLA